MLTYVCVVEDSYERRRRSWDELHPYLFNILRAVIFLEFSCEWVHGEGLVGGCEVYGRFREGTRCDHLL